MISFSPPDIRNSEIENVIEVLKSGWITTGPKTKEFERRISKYCETERTVCLNSATAGLEIILRILGIGSGDEVITSSYTYTASASVIHHVGARIVLIDNKKDSYEMDYEKLEETITEKTKAIIAVDLAGVICDYEKIFNIVKRKSSMFKGKNNIQEKMGRICVIADGAHSFGAKHKGIKSGNIADFTTFSFHAVKNLTTAEGGAVTWSKKDNIKSEDLYKYINILALHGQTKDALSKSKKGNWEYDIIYPGYKFNMTDIMAAIGLAQLNRYNEILDYRRKIIKIYDDVLMEKKLKVINHFDKNGKSSGHLYMVRLKNKDEIFRNKIISKLAEKNIATNVHYKPLPMFTAYKNLGFSIQDFPNAYDVYKNEITLPLNTVITEEEAYYVAQTLKELI